ncbi:MAG: cysteine desulfurase [Wenzhouxiangellaceae bacterium]
MHAASNLERGYDVDARRADFPVLQRRIHGHDLVYLDNAATAQRPRQVTAAIENFYHQHNANVHRGVHSLSNEATELYEGAREAVRDYIGAASRREIIFTRGTTESINLVAQSYARPRLQPGDEILVTRMEHHSNIVPWQMVCEQTGAVLKVAPINQRGELDLDQALAMLNDRVKLFALVHVSNALGTINPVADLVAAARQRGIPVLIDGAQALPHMQIDVRQIDCDFYCFSGHKMYGPTGIGVLYGREALLDAMPPWQGGGEMIAEVSFEKTVYSELPAKFEAGTPHMAGAVGLHAAIDYLRNADIVAIAHHEATLLEYATRQLATIEGFRLIGDAQHKASVLTFNIEGVHPHDLGTLLDLEGVAIRTGHHCAMPVTEYFGLPATARASFGLYNTHAEVDRLVDAVRKARKMLL